MNELTKKEKQEYCRKLKQEYNLSPSNIYVVTLRDKINHKELYEELKRRDALLEELKEEFIEVKPCEIKSFFKDKASPVASAASFISGLYRSRTIVDLRVYKTMVALKEHLEKNGYDIDGRSKTK